MSKPLRKDEPQKTAVTYTLRPGFVPPRGVNVQATGEAVAALGERCTSSELVPELLHVARDAASPLHAWFEWDDARASEAWRRTQANLLLRALVMVRVLPGKTEPEPMRVLVHIRPTRMVTDGIESHDAKPEDVKEREGWQPTLTVMADPELRAKYLTQARREMKSFRKRYDWLKELADVFVAMETVEKALHDTPNEAA